jgi:hypothetical protein
MLAVGEALGMCRVTYALCCLRVLLPRCCVICCCVWKDLDKYVKFWLEGISFGDSVHAGLRLGLCVCAVFGAFLCVSVLDSLWQCRRVHECCQNALTCLRACVRA